MKILAIDTATERCSVALRLGVEAHERSVETPKGHADLVLPMIAQLLQDHGLSLRDLDGIAYGRGPGAFTGVRIAVGVVQGLAYGAQLPTVGISDLAAVAQQFALPGDRVMVCMDARMGEVYAAHFSCDPQTGLVVAIGEEQVQKPEDVNMGEAAVFVGTGFKAYPQLQRGSRVHDAALPRATEIARLGEAGFLAGLGRSAAEARPVYVRDRVAVAKRS